MSVPNDFAIVQATFAGDTYDLADHADLARFVDDAVQDLHDHDPNWGHIIKKPGQTNTHGHGEDSTLYKLEDGTAWGVDFIEAAGGPAPKLRWGPDDQSYYTNADWCDPADHDTLAGGSGGGSTTPNYPYPDEQTAGKAYQDRVKATYTEAKRAFPDPKDPEAFRHFMRYGYSSHEMPEPEAADKHIAELRAQLGLPAAK